MAKKYITQLTGTTTPSLTGYTVYDNGSTTNKVTLGTLRQTLVNSGSHYFTGSQFISGDVLVGGASRYYTGQPEVIGAYNSGSFNSMILRGDSNTYLQTYIQNVNSGSHASTDVVVGADNGSEEAHYINLGINSSGNSDEWLGRANDTYLMSVAHDMYIGTFAVSGNTSDIHIFTSGAWESPQLFISSSGEIGYNKHFLTGLYDHEFSGSIHVDGQISASYFKGDGSQLTNLPGGGGASITNVTFSELNDLWDGGNLNAGQYYKITDYQTCYDQPNWTANGTAITTGNYKSGSIEELVVFATSTGSLSPYAHSLTYPKDTIKYNVAVTQTEVTNGEAKGRIYERIDEAGNRTDYDWRNVQFKRYTAFYCQNTYEGKLSLTSTETTASVIGVGTAFDNQFSVGDVLGVYNPNQFMNGGFEFYEVVDVSGSNYMGVTGSYYNDISDTYYSSAGTYSYASAFQTNTVSIHKDVTEYYTFESDGNPADAGWYNNYLGDNNEWNTFLLSNNVFRGGNYADNQFDSNVVGNTFDDDDFGNKIGRNFQYNTITNDFDNNTIGDTFQYNHIRCDFQENIIANNFQSNMITDDDGIDFNFNIINGDDFSHNWFIGWDHFHSNIITDRFYNNVIWNKFGNNSVIHEVYDNLFDGGTEYNQFKESFNNNKIYGGFRNNILNNFYGNTMLSSFDRNHFGGTAYSNTLSGSFYDNNIGHNFYSNTFTGLAGNNQIGVGFHGNTIGDGFGDGGGGPIGNKIGGNIYDNVIGTNFQGNTIANTFYENTIGDGFKQNTILANAVNNIDFNQYYGNISAIAAIANPNVGGTDGVYQLVETTTNGQGVNATFDVTVTGGTASATIVNVGKLYQEGDAIYITGSLIGGGTDLELLVDSLSPTPVVYTTADSTIVRNYNDDLKLTYVGSSLGIVGITETFD